MAEAKEFVDLLLNTKPIVIFSKSDCPSCKTTKKIFNSYPLKQDALEWIEINNRDDCEQIQEYLEELTGTRTVPSVFFNGEFFGGCDAIENAKKDNKLKRTLEAVDVLES